MNYAYVSRFEKRGRFALECVADIDHFRNELFINIVYGYGSRLRHGDYLPRPIVGLLVLLYSREYLFVPDCAMLQGRIQENAMRGC